jgi:hypothetical protein
MRILVGAKHGMRWSDGYESWFAHDGYGSIMRDRVGMGRDEVSIYLRHDEKRAGVVVLPHLSSTTFSHG